LGELGDSGRLWNARVTGDIGDRDIQSLSVDAECWDILEFGEMGDRGFRGSVETGWQGSGGGERVGRIRGNRGIKRVWRVWRDWGDWRDWKAGRPRGDRRRQEMDWDGLEWMRIDDEE